MAAAIERALPDVPDTDALSDKAVVRGAYRGIPSDTPVNPFEWFGGKKPYLREFIAYCRKGGFMIC